VRSPARGFDRCVTVSCRAATNALDRRSTARGRALAPRSTRYDPPFLASRQSIAGFDSVLDARSLPSNGARSPSSALRVRAARIGARVRDAPVERTSIADAGASRSRARQSARVAQSPPRSASRSACEPSGVGVYSAPVTMRRATSLFVRSHHYRGGSRRRRRRPARHQRRRFEFHPGDRRTVCSRGDPATLHPSRTGG
jgi:hypothetical protein